MSDDLVVTEGLQPVDPYRSIRAFEEIQRMAALVAKSDLTPQQFKGNIPNTVIALELSARMGASPLAVMQNLYVVRGKPSWAGKFVMAMIRSSGLYKMVRYQIDKSDINNLKCKVIATSRITGEEIEGPEVSYEMAKREGWWDKPGSKWQTMPELMIKYRAASFFGNTECPEVLCGLPTSDEVHDSSDIGDEKTSADEINEVISKTEIPPESPHKSDEKVTKGEGPHQWSLAAKKIIDAADKIGPADELDKFRAGKRKELSKLGDEEKIVAEYLENAYQALKRGV